MGRSGIEALMDKMISLKNGKYNTEYELQWLVSIQPTIPEVQDHGKRIECQKEWQHE
jgi:hypothetical protein